MTAADFVKLLNKGLPAGVYLFTGEEEYDKKAALELVRQKVLEPGFELMNESVSEGITIDKLIESAETLPFMAEKRLVIAKDPAFLPKPRKNGEEGAEKKADDELSERFKNWLAAPPEASVVILYARGRAGKTSSAYKALSDKAQIVEFELLTDEELCKWCRKRASQLGSSMGETEAQHLIERVGNQKTLLNTELEKLSALKEGGGISIGDIDSAVAVSVEAQVFDLLDLLLAHNAGAAYERLKRLLDAGEKPQSLLAIINWQLRMMTHVGVLSKAGMGSAEIAQRLGEREFGVRKTLGKCAGISTRRLVNAYSRSVQLTDDIRSSKISERFALDEMLVLMHELKKK